MSSNPEQPAHTATREEDSEESKGELVGEVLSDRYRLDHYIGGGGMGEVYKAEHVMMKKTVAIKVLRPDAAEHKNVVERFRREAQAAGNLDHPNICSATDFGRTDAGAFYLVMEYVEGRNLGDIIARHGAMAVDRAIHVADEVADALEVAHGAGVVHRDLKPENVMLVDEGGERESVKVLDFGVSRVQMADDMPSITKTGAVFGTPHYMSPEQAAGEEVDTRADLYGLGSVLYEMLTGRPVFEGEKSVHVMASHLKDEPTPPSEAADWQDIPPELDQLVMELLAKDPEDRPQSATEVRGRIEVVRHRLQKGGAAGISRSIEIRMPTAKWLKQAGNTTRRFYKIVDKRLPFGIDIDQLSGKKLAVITLSALATLTVLGALTAYGVSQWGDTRSTASVRSELSSNRQEFRNKPDVRAAMQKFQSGEPAAAARELASLEDKYGSNPHYSYLLGKFRAAAEKWKGALEAYEEATSRKPDYAVDDTLLSDLHTALASSDEETFRHARKILKAHIEREEVASRIARAAWESDTAEKRERARKLLEQTGRLSSLATWQRHAVELRAANGCEDHRKHIEAIASAGNPAGLDVLRIYDQKPKSGCGVFNNKDCYGCIRKDLADAIETLEATQ